MAPSRVSTPVKDGGRTGRTPDIVDVRRTGLGGGTYCAEATTARKGRRMDAFMFAIGDGGCGNW